MSSLAVIILVGLPTVIQLFAYGIQLPIFVIIIARCIYLSRLIGINVSMTISLIMEGLVFFWMLVRPVIFQKSFNKLEFIVFILMFIIVCIIEFFNESLYVYQDVSISEYNEMLLKQRILNDEELGRKSNKKKSKKGRKK